MTTLELDDDGRAELFEVTVGKYFEAMRNELVDATSSTMIGDAAIRIGPAVQILEKAIHGAVALGREASSKPLDDERYHLACLVASGMANGRLHHKQLCQDALDIVDTMAEVIRERAK